MGTVRHVNHEDRFGFYEQGSFRCRYKSELPLAAAAAAAVAAVGIPVIVTVTIKVSWMQELTPVVTLALAAVFVIIGTGAVRVVLGGQEFRYEADEKEFRIYREKGGKRIPLETLYYIDVVSVEFKKMVPPRGLMITVSTKYRKYRYQYLFRGSKNIRGAEDSPFYILERRRPAEERKGGED